MSMRLASSSKENERIKEIQEKVIAFKEKNSKIDEVVEKSTHF